MATDISVDRRKAFYFSKKNDDLLDYINSLEKQEQSKYIMRLIRFDLENKEEEYKSEIASLKLKLSTAHEEIEQLKEELIKCKSNSTGIDDEVMNKVLFTLADIKRDNDLIKNIVTSGDIPINQQVEVEEKMSPEEELELMSSVELPF